jgi:hypothetical protein
MEVQLQELFEGLMHRAFIALDPFFAMRFARGMSAFGKL